MRLSLICFAMITILVALSVLADVPSESMWGLRLARDVGGFDLSLSYSDARENVPVLRGLDDGTHFDD